MISDEDAEYLVELSRASGFIVNKEDLRQNLSQEDFAFLVARFGDLARDRKRGHGK